MKVKSTKKQIRAFLIFYFQPHVRIKKKKVSDWKTCTLKISICQTDSKIQIFTRNAQLFLNRAQRYEKYPE